MTSARYPALIRLVSTTSRSVRCSGVEVVFIRNAVVASLLSISGYASPAYANSCSNIVTFSSYDQSGLDESTFGINAVGTFRIAGEADEGKQPMFNLTKVACEKQIDESGKASGLECKLTQAVMWANEGKPDTDNPNCSLDVDTYSYSMKELQKSILTGIQETSACFNTLLVIDRNAKRIYQSFTRTKLADEMDRRRPGTCALPRTQVLMNCTSWPRGRKPGAPPRYCDFSNSHDK
jgi:hypothetical protein